MSIPFGLAAKVKEGTSFSRARAIQTSQVRLPNRQKSGARYIDRPGHVGALNEERFTLWPIPLHSIFHDDPPPSAAPLTCEALRVMALRFRSSTRPWEASARHQPH